MSEIQSVVFKRKFWTIVRARKWMKRRGLKSTMKVDRNKTQYRFRQLPPKRFKRFITKKIQPTVSFIIGFK